ncbi:MAG: NYN domain-containing protein [Chloroflexi bacterium]|nr:NYN domain-containing protein [Chloroflexota bacterium]
MTERQRKVALLIDYDNLQICYSRDAPGTQLDIGAVLEFAQTYGRVVVSRAYAEWGLLSERLSIWRHGVEPAFAPVMRSEGSTREGKSLCDTVMVADGVDLLWTMEFDVLVLVTSDKDMIPLARLARQRGVLVVVLGSDLTAGQLIECANDFVTYRHLLLGLGRTEERPSLVTHVREEPRARRQREANGLPAPETRLPREARTGRVPRELREPRVTRPAARRAEAVPAIEPAPAEMEVAPLAPLEAPVASPTDGLETAAPRRRRRRGGRGRRPTGASSPALAGEALEADDEGLESASGELEAAEAEPRESAREDQTRFAADPLAEAPADDLEPVPETLDEQPAPALELEPPSPTPLRVPRPEPRLKPWERWPEPAPARPTRRRTSGRHAPRAEGSIAPPEQRLEPDFATAPDQEVVATSAAEPAAEPAGDSPTAEAPAQRENGPVAEGDAAAAAVSPEASSGSPEDVAPEDGALEPAAPEDGVAGAEPPAKPVRRRVRRAAPRKRAEAAAAAPEAELP